MKKALLRVLKVTTVVIAVLWDIVTCLDSTAEADVSVQESTEPE